MTTPVRGDDDISGFAKLLSAILGDQLARNRDKKRAAMSDDELEAGIRKASDMLRRLTEARNEQIAFGGPLPPGESNVRLGQGIGGRPIRRDIRAIGSGGILGPEGTPGVVPRSVGEGIGMSEKRYQDEALAIARELRRRRRGG